MTHPVAVATLPNGIRVVTLPMPHLGSASVGVFVRTGSRDESARSSGISHFLEHMAFKGTHTRDCQRINLDAERLGAGVNAFTDKDSTAYLMSGLAEHAPRFLEMLADIVQNSSFPEQELERERGVILQEYAELADDPLAIADRLFDEVCWGEQPMGRPIIGSRRNIQRFTREELREYVASRYTGANIVVAVAGRVKPEEIEAQAQALFGTLPRGEPHPVATPAYRGGIRVRRKAGFSQSQVLIGFPVESLREDHYPSLVAASLFGEGMSSPLLDRIRERRGLVYHAASSVDLMDTSGLFVIDALTTPEHLDEFFAEVTQLLLEQAERIDATDLERARNQLKVSMLLSQESPMQRLEAAAEDLFVHGEVQSPESFLDRVDAVSAAQVREAFARMLAAPPSIALAGKGADERFLESVGARILAHRAHR
ncbi:M16 family metallopeptidase [Caldimonas tepidiphila]|uniref:M16 family metallopeptidase n=1 Tax=Caldimonas tepidiphila TaxID=2315841 RepID=UPI000E5AAD33|nr:pitrilysin family protein [Caldimonas tepidiphila]